MGLLSLVFVRRSLLNLCSASLDMGEHANSTLQRACQAVTLLYLKYLSVVSNTYYIYDAVTTLVIYLAKILWVSCLCWTSAV